MEKKSKMHAARERERDVIKKEMWVNVTNDESLSLHLCTMASVVIAAAAYVSRNPLSSTLTQFSVIQYSLNQFQNRQIRRKLSYTKYKLFL